MKNKVNKIVLTLALLASSLQPAFAWNYNLVVTPGRGGGSSSGSVRAQSVVWPRPSFPTGCGSPYAFCAPAAPAQPSIVYTPQQIYNPIWYRF